MSKGRGCEEAEDESRDFIVEDEEVRGLVRGQIVPHHRPALQPSRRIPTRLVVLGRSDNFYGGLLQEPSSIREREEEEDEEEERVGREEEIEIDEVAGEEQRLAVNWSGSNSPQHSSTSQYRGREDLPRLHHLPHHHPLHHHLPHQHQHPLVGQRTDPEESSSDIGMSLSMSDRLPNQSTASLLDSMERRTQRTYRYGIGLVCVGATLNWLGFAQGHGYVDPLRYLGVACVISGSFCVCLAMCRWLGRPISVSTHRVSGLTRLDYQDERNGRQNGDVHVINVSVPMYAPPMHEEYRPTKPPDYEAAVQGEPPPYDEAIKLDPGALFSKPPPNSNMTTSSDNFFACGHPSPSHSTNLITTRPALSSPEAAATAATTTTGITTTTNAATLNGPTVVSLSSNMDGGDLAGGRFHGDCVVMVDASESANSNTSNLNAKLGAPPPYTKEYTPSPRHSVCYSGSNFPPSSFPTQTSSADSNAIVDNGNQLNANQLSIVSNSSNINVNNNNNNHSNNHNNHNFNDQHIVPTHSPNHMAVANNSVTSQVSSSNLNSVVVSAPSEQHNLNLNNNHVMSEA